MKISNRIEPAPVTEGTQYFHQHSPSGVGSLLSSLSSTSADTTGDNLFMEDILRSISSRHGERAMRAKWRAYITKFTRISATFEEIAYGATALYVMGPGEDAGSDTCSPIQRVPSDPGSLRGHGYVWPDEATKNRDLAAWVYRIEGWRNTRSYYHFNQDTATLYLAGRPVQSIDVHHQHDRLRAETFACRLSRYFPRIPPHDHRLWLPLSTPVCDTRKSGRLILHFHGPFPS